MQVTETLSEGLKRAYTVVVPASDIDQRRGQRLAELGRTVNLPGFRPGKVPASVVKQRFGGSVTAEILEDSVNEATNKLLNERGLRAAAQPKVDLVSAEDTKDLEFKVAFEVLPEIALPDFSTLEITRLRAEPQTEAIDSALNQLATRQRELIDVEEVRPAAKGDILTVDFIGRVDGEAFQGGTGTDMDVEIGGEGFIPGFSEQMEGMTPGETRFIDVTFPEEYGAKELAGKAATFEIAAKKLKIAKVPELGDDLARKVGFESLEEVRSALVSRAQAELDQLSRLRTKRALLDKLADAVSFPVPESMLDREFAQIWQRLEADRKAGRLDAEDEGKDEGTLRAEYLMIAERRVRLGLLLAEIGRANGVVVGSDEMNAAIRAEAMRYPGQERMVAEFFAKNPQAAEGLRGPLYEEKVVDFVLELAKVDDKLVTPEELAKDPEPVSASAPPANEIPAEAPAAEPVQDEAAS